MPRPMTITEKIFAAHAGLDEVKAGDLITAKVDITLIPNFASVLKKLEPKMKDMNYQP